MLDHQGESAGLPVVVSIQPDAPQEVLGLLARRRPSRITDLSGAAQVRTVGVHPMGCQPAEVEIDRSNPVIHSSAELSYSQARARAPIDPRGV
jgi:hypothetical protein